MMVTRIPKTEDLPAQTKTERGSRSQICMNSLQEMCKDVCTVNMLLLNQHETHMIYNTCSQDIIQVRSE